MKEIIGGKTYNTDTARYIKTKLKINKIGVISRTEVFEHMYQRRKDDEFFLHEVIFQYDENDNMYYTWETIDPISGRLLEYWMNKDNKVVFGGDE